ncbi:MAG TPA: GNAT family N-acetyltransferase [Thermoanaerobaculia bacterium]|nr:GNAT family N-acetyltransferase [Thermoanaerobaculia bacterium]
MKLRRADPGEAAWINERYASVEFLPSDLSREIVVVAEIDGDRAGIARLVPVDERSCELGGMLVFEDFRGRGVARALIDELLRHAEGREVYCIPFADLESLYAAAGFERADDAPQPVREKLEWCQRTYDRAAILMKRTR